MCRQNSKSEIRIKKQTVRVHRAADSVPISVAPRASSSSSSSLSSTSSSSSLLSERMLKRPNVHNPRKYELVKIRVGWTYPVSLQVLNRQNRFHLEQLRHAIAIHFERFGVDSIEMDHRRKAKFVTVTVVLKSKAVCPSSHVTFAQKHKHKYKHEHEHKHEHKHKHK